MRPQALSLLVLAAVALPSAIARAQAPLPPTGTGGTATGVGTSPGFGPGETARTAQTVEDDLVAVPRGVRTAARPTTLPDPVHDGADLSLEHAIASLSPKGGGEDRLTANLFHLDAEARIVGRFYVGAAWGFAASREPRVDADANGRPDGAHTEIVLQQPLLFARIAKGFARDRYVVGAGFGVVPPLFTHDDVDDRARIDAATASSLASVVRPWDVSTFLDRRLTLRPWIDVRAESRRLVFQLRQAFDGTFGTGSATCTSGECPSGMGLLSITTLFLGWKPTREVALGLEAWEVYLLRTQYAVDARDRSAFALSPGVRFFYRWVEPSVSLLLPVGPPLLGASDSYFGLRVNVRVWLTGR